MKNKRTIVQLPNTKPEVELPGHLASLLQAIINSGRDGINVYGLHSAGCPTYSSALARLKAKGAVITTELRDACDPQGMTHKRIAHHIYQGWKP